jgi:hypothetical protein
MAQVLASDYLYTNTPLRARVTFTNLEGDDTYFVWNGFTDPISSNPITLFYVDMERAVLETGSFNILIDDSQNIVNKDHLRNTKVYIELGRTEAEFQTFIIGFADILTPRRPRSFYQEYLISGPSTKIQAAELMLLIRKATSKTNNPDYAIGNLIEESLDGNKWRPLNREDIQSLTHWQTDGINKGALNNLYFPRINEVLTTHWDFLERMSALSGAFWDIDYSQATYPFDDEDTNEIFTFDYPDLLPSGINIKSGDLKVAGDDGTKTSYILDSFQIEDNASADANVATRLYTINAIDQATISSSFVNQGFNTLTSRAIAQQFVVENDQRRITDLAFILSKVGEPESPNNRVNGDLCMDFGDNTPRGKVLATFKIDISDIKTTPSTIFVNDVDVKVRFLQGENFIWVRLFQRSGKDGDPNTDAANVIKWHHNNQFSTPQTFRSATSTNNGGDYKLRDTMTWNSTLNGPTYTYSVFSKINRLLARTNPNQAKILRTKEAFLDTSFIQDPASANRLMAIILSQRSKARRSLPEFRVTNPYGTLFRPYMTVGFEDGLSEISQQLQVQRARYVISAIAGESPIGAFWCDLSLGGSFNSLLGNCSCG